jgi:hypothetical protein
MRYREGTTQRSPASYPTKADALSVQRAVERGERVAYSDLLSSDHVRMMLTAATAPGWLPRYAAICRGPQTTAVLQAYQRSAREGFREFRRAQDRSGVQPPDLPGPPLWLGWGPVMGEQEAGAFFSVAAALELAVAGGEPRPGASGWRAAQQEIARRHLAASRPELDGQSWLEVVTAERLGEWARSRGEARRALVEPMLPRLAGRPLQPVPGPTPAPTRPSRRRVGRGVPAGGLGRRPGAGQGARASGLLRRVITLARWVGTGRPVSRHGELIPPDARALVDALGLSEALAKAPGGWKVTGMRDVPPLTKAFYLAVEIELVAVRRSGILPGPRIGDCDRLDHGPAGDEVALGLWEELFDLTARQAATPPADPQPPRDSFSDWADGLTPRALAMLYERQDAVDLNDLLASLISEQQQTGAAEPLTDEAFLAALVGVTVRAPLPSSPTTAPSPSPARACPPASSRHRPQRSRRSGHLYGS